jgi:hypothetical protein
MQDNNRKFPGVRYEDQATAMPRIRIPEGERKQYRRDDYEQDPKDDYEAPRKATRKRVAKPRTESEKGVQMPDLPFAWFWRPLPASKDRETHSPAWRATMVGIGFLILCFSAYLSGLALQQYIPAFKNASSVSFSAMLSGTALTLIFMAVELALFRMKGFSLFTVGLVAGSYSVDIWINIDGVVQMWQLDNLWGHGLATAMALVLGIGAAYLPEKFMSLGWR